MDGPGGRRGDHDPGSGVFVSVDPLLDPGNPAQFNAYVYAGNNPATWSDPSGLAWTGPVADGGDHRYVAKDKNATGKPKTKPTAGSLTKTATAGTSHGFVPRRAAPGCGASYYLQACGSAPSYPQVSADRGPGSLRSLWRSGWSSVASRVWLRPPGSVVSGSPLAGAGAWPSLAEVQSRRVPKGRSDGVRTVRSDAELEDIYGMLSRGGEPVHVPRYKGTWLERGDGIRLGLREASKSGGRTIDIRYLDGTIRKVHID